MDLKRPRFFSTAIQEIARSSADWISLSRAVLVVALLVMVSLHEPLTSTLLAVAIGGFIALVALDAVDGIVARAQGTSSSFGSYIDVLCDRVTEYAGYLYLLSVSRLAHTYVIVIVTRDVLVDIIKVVSAARGHDLDRGVLVRHGWRLGVVASPFSKATANALRVVAVSVGLLIGSEHLTSPTALIVPLAILTVLTIVRGVASISELPATFRLGRAGPPDVLASGFVFQAALGLLVLVAVLAA